MINFCLTNDLSLSSRKYPNYINLHNGFIIGYEKEVEVYETSNVIILFCGIMWQGDIQQFEDIDSLIPNGQFYAIRIDKHTNNATIITDFIETFSIFSYVKDKKVLITNKLISFSYKHFTLNNDWIKAAINNVFVDRKLLKYDRVSDYPAINNYSNDIWYTGITPINDVNMVGPGTFFTLNLSDYKTSNRLYYDARKDYIDVAYDTLDKLTFDKVTSISQDILKNNIDCVYKKYGKRLVACLSNGVDSLHIASILGDRIQNINVVGYGGDFFTREPSHKLSALYELFSKGKTHILDKESYDELYNKVTLDHCDIPYNDTALIPEIMLMKNKHENGVFLKGTFGDEIFWHDSDSGIVTSIHNLQATNLEQAESLLEQYYCYQPALYSKSRFEFYKSKTFMDGILTNHYYKQKAYIRDELAIYDQLVVSPFIDINLRKLMPMADDDARNRNILNAESQRINISETYIKHLNMYKGGMEESHMQVDRMKITSKVLKCFLRKWHN